LLLVSESRCSDSGSIARLCCCSRFSKSLEVQRVQQVAAAVVDSAPVKGLSAVISLLSWLQAPEGILHQEKNTEESSFSQSQSCIAGY
jgi:hypothetical protein